jgi:hypothetical protein
MNTERLIDALAQSLAPSPPLASPGVRAGWWLLGAVAYLSVITLMMASPAEVATNAGGWPFMFYQLAAIVTAATAAAAAFASTVPGHSGRMLPLTALAAIAWLGSLVIGAAQEWTRDEVNLAAPGEWGCVAVMLLGGGLPGLGLALMLRQGASLAPALTAGMGTFATVILASVAACLSHPHPSTAITFVWHGTTILVLVAIAATAGRAVLPWNTPRYQ